MDAQTFFIVIVKSLMLLALAITFIRTIDRPGKARQSRRQQKLRSKSKKVAMSAPRLDVRFNSSQQLSFEWRDVAGATHYQLLERTGPDAVFQNLGAVIPTGRGRRAIHRPLHSQLNTQYVLRAYNDQGYIDSAALCIGERLTTKLNYLQKHHIDPSNYFGFSVNQSAGGRTLIIAEPDPTDDSHSTAYVFLRDVKGQWNKLAYMRDNKTTNLAVKEPSPVPLDEQPQLSPAKTAMPTKGRGKKHGMRWASNWQGKEATTNLRWMNFNSP